MPTDRTITFKGQRVPEEKITLQCQECGKVFKLSPHSSKFATMSVACPKCKSEDVDIASGV